MQGFSGIDLMMDSLDLPKWKEVDVISLSLSHDARELGFFCFL
jgi:hypothetical protein